MAISAVPFLMTLVVTAQDSLFIRFVPKQAVKISPFHLVSFYPTLQLAYEMRVASRFTVQAEGGVVLNAFNDNDRFQNKRGAKAKLELHYYFWPVARAKMIFYGAFELYWNAVNFDRRGVQEECFDVDCNHRYTREFNYKVTYREPGFGVKAGFVKYFSKFVFMDINSGWGVRFIDYTDPFNNRAPATFFWEPLIPMREDRVVLSTIVGIRLLDTFSTRDDNSLGFHSLLFPEQRTNYCQAQICGNRIPGQQSSR